MPAIRIGKFCSNLVKFEALEVQEVNNMTLFQFHRSDAFPFLRVYIPVTPVILVRGNPYRYNKEQSSVAIDQ
jgi:hypothetical protein